MKLETLRKVFEQVHIVKLYVLTGDFCLCAYANQPHSTAEGLRVSLGASVRVVLSSMEVIHEPLLSGTLFLKTQHKVTRRIRTHQRHLMDHLVPEEYFDLAKSL